MIAEGSLTPLSSKTHISYQFHLSEPCPFLVVDFTYSPKVLDDKEASRPLILEAIASFASPSAIELQKEKWEQFLPLQNLLTVSIDDPAGFRGSAHRHSPDQRHILSSDEASPGFLAGPVQSGIWKITISVHCIVTPTCMYRLSVKKGRDDHELGAL
ncbi:hypothetical protein EV213_11448 [Aureibacillus halotolerans]|uniref:Uncharacterized protein n=2 Tax=Aureibacillus halotolerans TaxID=1508390 RepID=A0A4R6TYQ2_9BACI|nr:hypothetical protein EV213_11448 [Aureibacillus halotolerans]